MCIISVPEDVGHEKSRGSFLRRPERVPKHPFLPPSFVRLILLRPTLVRMNVARPGPFPNLEPSPFRHPTNMDSGAGEEFDGAVWQVAVLGCLHLFGIPTRHHAGTETAVAVATARHQAASAS